jgi:hypothetical protein
MKYGYEITPRPVELGGGWRLQLLEDGAEAGGGAFPVPAEDPHVGMTWWNSLSESDRAFWLQAAKSARPADARQAWREAEAYDDAEREARSWLDSRGPALVVH